MPSLAAVRNMATLTDFAVRQPRLLLYLLSQVYGSVRGLHYSQTYTDAAGRTLPPADCGGSSPSQNPLRAFFDSHCSGRGIWKWAHYIDIYDRHFRKFVGRDVRVVEIGVYSGGSLDMWRKYFGDKCHIYGIDIEPACLAYRNEYTDIFIGDQGSREFWRSFKERVAPIDILIDDGGHRSKQQIVTLEEMLPHVRPGGIYVCEDVHGINKRFASFVQAAISSMNEMRPSDRGSEGEIIPTEFQAWIQSAHFYPYVVVLEKAEAPVRQFKSIKKGTEWQPFPQPKGALASSCWKPLWRHVLRGNGVRPQVAERP